MKIVRLIFVLHVFLLTVTLLRNHMFIYFVLILSNFRLAANSDYWIGLMTTKERRAEKSWFYWLDGSEYRYTNWVPNEPTGDSNCVRIQEVDGKWLDKKCNSLYYFICQKGEC